MCNLKRNMNGSGIFYYFRFYVLSLRNLDGTYCSAGRDRVSLNCRSFKDVLRPTWKYWSLEKQFCSVSSWVHDSPHMQVRVLREKLLFTAWRSCRPFLLLSESAAVLMSFIWSCTGNNKVQWITLLIYLTHNAPSLYWWKVFGESSVQLVQMYPAVFQHKIAGSSLAPSVTVAIRAGNEIFVNLISLISFPSKIKINYLHHWRKEQKPERWCWLKK